MRDNVQPLWEKPEHLPLKLECLRLATGGAVRNDPKDILPAAQAMYDWLVSKGDDNRSS